MDAARANTAAAVGSNSTEPSIQLQVDKEYGVEEKHSHSVADIADEEGDNRDTGVPNAEPRQFSKARLFALVATCTGASFLNTLTVQSAVIVLPTIGAELHIPNSRQQWIVSSYSLTFGCFLLLWGRLADVYGKRIIFIWGCAWVMITTLVLPFVKNEIGFDVLRGLQGLGAAANVPTALGLLGVTFPPGQAKNLAFATYGAGAPLGSVFGNILGGVVGEYLNWKWIFWILAIMAAMVTVAGIFVIPPPPIKDPKGLKSQVDWIGGTLITTGLLALMFALTEGNVVGWSTPWIPVLIVISVILIVCFSTWQWYLEKKSKTGWRPLMKVSIFLNFRFSTAMLIMGLFFATFNDYLILVTYFYQDYQGQSVIQTTLRFLPTGIGGIIIAFITGKFLLHRVPGHYLLMFGTFASALTALLLALPFPPNYTYWAYGFPAMVFAVLGADVIYPTLTLFTAHSLPQEDQAMGGGLINMMGQVGRSVGLAIATAIQTAVTASVNGVDVQDAGKADFKVGDEGLLKGLRAAECFGVAMSVVAFALAMFAFRGVGVVGQRKH